MQSCSALSLARFQFYTELSSQSCTVYDGGQSSSDGAIILVQSERSKAASATSSLLSDRAQPWRLL